MRSQLTEVIAAATLSSGQRQLLERLLARLTGDLSAVLGGRLIGAYLYGSLVTGDFDFDVSDLDLVVVMRQALDAPVFAALHGLHTRVIGDYPAWDDRLELAYISAAGLRHFRTISSRLGIISPGEPFHLIKAGDDWLISWYALREHGIALRGPPITALIDPLPKQAWLAAVSEHILAYRHSVKNATDAAFLAYIVLTVARGLFSLAHQGDGSKAQAARWLADRKPQWRELLMLAMRIRRSPKSPPISAEELLPQVEAYLVDLLPAAEAEASDRD